MIQLDLIGIGAGNPDHLTLEARQAINAAGLILLPLKGAEKTELADLRRLICDRHLSNPETRVVSFDLPVRDAGNPDYRRGVDDWHDAIAAAWAAQITAHLGDPPAGRVALLIWGDPSLYDSSLRIAARLQARWPLRLRVVPGITALQALCAAHAIPLNEIGAPVQITTGRQLRQGGWPAGVERLAVMLDQGGAFEALDPQPGVTIWWGAYLGMEEEILISGPLDQVGAQILSARAEARARHGWIMDIYILSRD